MKKRLFFYTALIILAGLLGFFILSVYITHTNNLKLAKDTVIETTQIYANLYNEGADISNLVKAGNDTRITIIAADGTILADSRPLDVDTLENHLDRPEIQAAASGSPAAFVRHSETLEIDFIYYALKANGGDGDAFIRAAIPVAKIDAYLYAVLPLFILLLIIVAVLCFLLIRNMGNRIIALFGSVEHKLRLLSKGEYKPGAAASSYEEMEKISREIDDVALILQNNFDALRDEKVKLDYILNNIADGLFVIDENKNITLVNTAARGIFNTTADITGRGLGYLTYDKALTASVEDCVAYAKDALFEFAQGGSIFLTTVNRLPGTSLTMVVLSDVTQNRENAKRREEFFANASHELKTPLTAIKGFNELTALNNKDESINKYIDSITRETDRMLSLIGDMLKLSELENMQSINPVSVSLARIVHEVCEAVSPAISAKGILFEMVGDAMVTAEQGHIYELVKNLIENAVRYNNQGGRVSVTVEKDEKAVQLTVSDDGIGISLEEQSRIFERFYRVEKSRSQRSGGTGLGLSIVKHICALYDWKLSLKSRLGVGTDITVTFG